MSTFYNIFSLISFLTLFSTTQFTTFKTLHDFHGLKKGLIIALPIK